MQATGRLSKYIAKKFLLHFALTAIVFISLISLIDFLEIARRAQNKNVPLHMLVSMVFFKLPTLLQEIAFFLVLIASLLTLNSLNARLEIAVMRSVGVSVWGILRPIIILSFLIGVFWVTLFNPYVSWSKTQYEKRDAIYLKGSDIFAERVYANGGLWLREENDNGYIILIKTPKSSKSRVLFFDAEFMIFSKDKSLSRRIFAERADLKNGKWQMKNIVINQIDQPPQIFAKYELDSSLEEEFILKKIENSYAETSEVSFWNLAEAIKSLEDSGFSATRYKVYLQNLLSLPFLFVGMAMLAACFSLLPPRSRKAGFLFITALGLSFLIFFVKNMIISFGSTSRINYLIAGWTPSLLVIAGSLYYLLCKEEGAEKPKRA